MLVSEEEQPRVHLHKVDEGKTVADGMSGIMPYATTFLSDQPILAKTRARK
jgi:hypothetical protein